MNIGQLIRQNRKQKGLTQTDVAKAIGVSTNTISKYERNIIENMGREKVIALSKLLDIPTVSFIEAIDNNHQFKNDDQITAKELAERVISKLNNIEDMNEQEKALLMNTINVILSKKE